MLRAVPVLVVAVLLCAAGYEAAVALGGIGIGSAPGEGPRGGGAVLVAALVALVAGFAVLFRPAPESARPGAAAVLAAAAFVVARFYTFDPYYAPALRRMSDGGLVPAWWIAALAASAAATAATSLVRPRPGMRAGAAVLLLCALTALFESGGH